jgi:acetyl esterase/lipase
MTQAHVARRLSRLVALAILGGCGDDRASPRDAGGASDVEAHLDLPRTDVVEARPDLPIPEDAASARDAATQDVTVPPACTVASEARTVTPGAQVEGPCASASFSVQTLAFTSTPQPLSLDLFLPRGARPRATVLWIHGGGWTSGSRTNVEQARWLVCEGYAVASIDYRLTGVAQFPAQIHDVKAAVRFLRARAEEFQLDPERFAAFGSSAGGHLAALLGTSGGEASLEDPAQGHPGVSSRVQAVVDWYGPTDLPQMDGQLLAPPSMCAPGSATHGTAGSAESRLVGCAVREPSCAARAAAASPLPRVDPSDPPFLIMHGDRDCVVPQQQSSALAAALRGSTGCVASRLVLGAAHGGQGWLTAEVRNEVRGFLRQVFP